MAGRALTDESDNEVKHSGLCEKLEREPLKMNW